MEGNRRQKWDNQKIWQNNRKPPRVSKQSVPSWEKQFCKVIGSMDWATFLESKKYVNIYKNVMKWDDSAGEEAFLNAKKRYWAEINSYACDIPLPGPDLCIDEIDYDQVIDPDLTADLEAEPVGPTTEDHHDPVVIFSHALYAGQSFSTVGWGDNDENFPAPVEYPSVIPDENAPANYGATWDQRGGDLGINSGGWESAWEDDDWGYWNYGGAGIYYESD